MMSTTSGVDVAMPSSRPAVSLETTTWSAPDCLSRWTFSASRTDATMCAFGASSRAVSVTSTAVSSRFGADHDRARVLHRGDAQDVRPGRRAVHGDEAERARRVEGLLVGVDDDDLARRRCSRRRAAR